MLLTQNGRRVKFYAAGTIQQEQAQDTVPSLPAPDEMCEDLWNGASNQEGLFCECSGLI